MKKRAMLGKKKIIPTIFDFYCQDGKIRPPQDAKGKSPIAICVKVNDTEAIFMYYNHIDNICWSPSQSGNICPYSSDGLKNTEIVLGREDYSPTNYPAFDACVNMQASYSKLEWYMPSINEISSLFISNRNYIQNAFVTAGISSNIVFDQQPVTNDIRYLVSTDNYQGNVRQCHAYSMGYMNDAGRWKYAINDNYAGTYSYSKVIPFANLEL